MAFPQVTLARDFIADVARGDGIGAALDSLGYIGPVKNLLGKSPVIASFIEKHPNKFDGINDYLRIEELGIDVGPAAKRTAISDGFEDTLTRFNGRTGVAPYDVTKNVNVLGTWDSYGGSKRYIDLSRYIGGNSLSATLTGADLNTANKEYLYLIIGDNVNNGRPIALSVHPDVVRSSLTEKEWATSTFRQEIEYLEKMGYRVSTTTTDFRGIDDHGNAVTYSLYTMEKVS